MQLNITEQGEIIKIEIKELIEHVKDNKMEIKLDQSSETFLAERGFDQKFGARPLKRAIQKFLEDPLAEEMLLGHIKEGDEILVKYPGEGDILTFNVISEEKNETKYETQKC